MKSSHLRRRRVIELMACSLKIYTNDLYNIGIKDNKLNLEYELTMSF